MQTSQRFKLKYTALATLCVGLTACGGGSSTAALDDSDPNAVVTEDAEARIDRVRPTISVTAPSATGSISTTSKSLALSGMAKDNRQVARVTWVTDKGASGRATQSAAADQVTWSSGTITLPTGSNRITVRAYDRAGNVASQVVTVTVGSAPAAAPAPVASTPAPAPVASTPAPAPVASTPAPAPVASTPAPAPVASTPAPAPAAASGLTYINRSLPLPTGYAGDSVALAQPTSLQPVFPPADGYTGAFRTVCTFSHMAYDDPIVYPGQVGAAHLHSFFGNVLANANSTATSLSTTGASTCRGGILNRSSYWVPSMINSSGVPQAPEDMVMYYKTGYQGVRNEQITVPPAGLRIIAGNSKSQAPQDVVRYGCAAWAPGFLAAEPTSTTIPTCTDSLIMRVEYPQCWDGVNLDSPDHQSHMAYGRYGVGCPSTHPVAIPDLTMNFKWRLNGTSTAGWRLSSDIVGAPAGSSGHADWFIGWDRATITTFVTQCLNAGRDCGTYLLGDGRMLVGGEARP
jgi:Domain of unknown function (DUF1996)